MANRTKPAMALLMGAVMVLGGQSLVATEATAAGQPKLCAKRPVSTAMAFGPDLAMEVGKNQFHMKNGTTCVIFDGQFVVYQGSKRVPLSPKGDKIRFGANIVVSNHGKTVWKSKSYKGAKQTWLSVHSTSKSEGKYAGKITIGTTYKSTQYWVRP